MKVQGLINKFSKVAGSRSIYKKNQLYFYILTMNNPKIKLKQFQLQWHQKG